MLTLDSISHPIRVAILRFFGGCETASLPEIADAVGVHRNTVRPHVAALEDAGALAATRDEPRGRGRPALRYRLRPEWVLPTVSYRGLAELLAAALDLSQIEPQRLDGLGREWGRYLLGRPGGGQADAQIPRVLERLAFNAEVKDDVVRLGACPCPLVSPGRPDLVCRLAAAAIDGLLAGASDGRRVATRTNDHAQRRCTVALQAAPDSS